MLSQSYSEFPISGFLWKLPIHLDILPLDGLLAQFRQSSSVCDIRALCENGNIKLIPPPCDITTNFSHHNKSQ